MYKLLLVTDREDIRKLFRDQIDWAGLNCRPPFIASSAQEGIDLLNTQAIDAVGYHLPKPDAIPLSRFLRYGRPSLPIFEVASKLDKQLMILHEMADMLNRLHADFADEYYDENAMLNIMRDELVHTLLAGEWQDGESLKRELKLIRSHVRPERPCVLYEIDMPQGEVYLSEHHGQAQERLESALRNNFFGRYVDGIYYAVAVLEPRHIRVACMSTSKEEWEDAAAFAARAERHVQDSILKIKEYLDLDMAVVQSSWLQNLNELLRPAQAE